MVSPSHFKRGLHFFICCAKLVLLEFSANEGYKLNLSVLVCFVSALTNKQDFYIKRKSYSLTTVKCPCT